MSKQTANSAGPSGTPGDPALEQLLSQAARLQHQTIARRAHEIFLARGCANGQDLRDWLQAKRELFGLSL